MAAFIGGFGIGGGSGSGSDGICGRGGHGTGRPRYRATNALAFGMVQSKEKHFDGFVNGEESKSDAGYLPHSYEVEPAFVDSARPVIVILSWMGASRKNIEKYAEFYCKQGFDVYFYLNNVTHAMIPTESRRQANRVAQTISSIPENRPVFVHAFSIGTGIYGYVVDMMARGKTNLDNIAGVIYDSGPSKIFPHDVAKGLHLVFPTISRGIWNTVTNSFFTVTQARKGFSVPEQALLNNQHPSVPQLYMYSSDDTVISKVADSIGHFMDENRRRGVDIFCKVFDNSKHAAHYRYHPEEYVSNVNAFMQQCLEKHRSRASTAAAPIAGPDNVAS